MKAFTKRIGVVSLLAIVCIVFIIFYISSLALAVDRTIFGPETLSIERWSIQLSSHKFSADEFGQGVLVIAKNTPDKNIRGGFIIFNHEIIYLRNFLRGSNTVFEKTIFLKGKNRMIVFMRGTPGASIIIEVRKKSVTPPSTVTFSAEPSSIKLGESSVLTWNTTGADSVTIDQNIGRVSLSGSITVSPIETTTYILTTSGPGGDASASVTIEVAPALFVNMKTDPETIQAGGSSTLSWNSYNIDKAFIDGGIGTVSAEGSITVSPEHTTTYTITATGTVGSALATATVTVTGNPARPPEGSFGEQYSDLIPPDATVKQYDSKRFSVITGLVQAIDDAPVADVSVTVLGHPKYGTAKTDADGRFSIPVEGGATMTVNYQKQGLLTSQRAVYVPWNNIAITETIKMIDEDPKATTVTFDGNPETVVTHRSTEVSDEFGSRSCTMVFKGDNKAYLVDKDGNDVYGLTTITTRATEYTTPESMSAILPPTSAYTYCAELSVDGAPRVRFEKPVVTWVNNFLSFDVGMVVPVGYYDRDRGVWVPADNGVVVKLLDTDTDGIVDALDANGDDQPDDLNNDGLFSDEVTGLTDPGAYDSGATFWRVEVTHFSPFDCNWPPPQMPREAIEPNPKSSAYADGQQPEDCNTECSSYTEDRSRIIHEDIFIPGTDIKLHYAGDRVTGYQYGITVPASGDTVPVNLKRIEVRLCIAGRPLMKVLEPLPNQKTTFVWDGLDWRGNPVTYPITASGQISFVYTSVYYVPSYVGLAFGKTGMGPTTIETRQESFLGRRYYLRINPKPRPAGKGVIAAGWTLSNHHQLSSVDPSILNKGDGSTVKSVNSEHKSRSLVYASVIDSVGSEFAYPTGVASDGEGNLYVAETWNNCIKKIDVGGQITIVAGNGTSGFSGDGGPAIDAQLSNPLGITIDSEGNLYIADMLNHRIRKVDTNGIITTVAGGGTFAVPRIAIVIPDPDDPSGYSGDDGPAIEAKLNGPTDVAFDSWGNLYIADRNNQRIRKVDTVGIITTIAGGCSGGGIGDEGLAVNACLNNPNSVAIDQKGNLYISEERNHRIRKVDTVGIITTVAGNGIAGYSGDGGLATEAQIYNPEGVAVDSEGNLYIADGYNWRVRTVNTHGIITTVAGTGNYGYSGDGGAAKKARLSSLHHLTIDPAGILYFADSSNHLVRTVGPPAVCVELGGIEGKVFVEDNGTGHAVSPAGRHMKTIDLDNGVTLNEFGYDEDNKLISITDRFGGQTTIQRDGDGIPTSIISPDGIVTYLAIDADNHLTRITYADGSYYGFEYTVDGLMTAKMEPEGNRFEHRFNELGRLTDATDEEGGHWHYEKMAFENGDILTETTTGEGNTTSYLDHTYSTGRYLSTITDPTGSQTLYERSADGLTVNKNLSCGMDLAFTYDLDPEYRFKYVSEVKETTPASRQRVTERDKTYHDTNSDDIPDFITETVTVNGKETTLEHNIIQSTKIITSPEGRTVASYYHPENLLTTRLTIPGLHDTNYGYDTRGRLTSLITGTRETTYTYNARGFLNSATDPENHTTTYACDPVGRITGVSRPDGSSVGFNYDRNGNMTVLNTPSNIDHQFGYNRVNHNSSYVASISGRYSYVYDRDRRLTQINFPSGNRINNIYDKTRLLQIQTPEGNIDFTYLCGTKVDSITNGTDTVTYGYDGKLITTETLNGTVNKTLAYSYDSDFNMTGFAYGGNTESYTYDNDGLLTGAGRFTINRSTQNGLPESVTGGSLNLGRSFNGYGEVAGQTYTVNSQPLTSWDLTRNDNGGITEKTETADGTTFQYAYTYDPLGRLRTVTRDGTLVEEYRYDLNGTRTFEMNTLRGITGRTFTYSDEDHLLTAGTVTYQYNSDGFLTTKTDGTEETHYDYSSRGELLGVALPNGTTIDYIHDPLGRRIAKKVNGTITEKYIWQGLTRLLAVYDGSDNLKMRFEYADSRMPYAMTKDDTIYYFTCDQVGSLRIVADSSGNVVKKINYDSFGNIINDSNPAFDIPFGFAGGLFDTDTGLIRFGVRDYDPDIGRWTAIDPILFNGGDTDLYGYCLCDPVNLVDPEGQFGVAGFGIGVFMGGYAGFVSGLQNHNILAGIIGGAFGAATGAIVGTFAPNLSASIGGTIGGAMGGMVSVAISKKIANPCINQTDYIKEILKGGLIGGVTGYMGSGMLSTVKILGAPDTIARIAASLFTTPISMGLDLVSL